MNNIPIFINLTDEDGGTFILNASKILSMEPDDTGARIESESDDYHCSESPVHVQIAINAAANDILRRVGNAIAIALHDKSNQ